jgi:hypothetical protein
MKQTLLSIIESDKTYNKSATRYLYKSHPHLWKDILNTTNFLPDDAKAKQRVWHILNDIFERPVCPITGKYVKWHENRYLETVDRHAKGKLALKRGKCENLWTAKTQEKRSASIKKGFETGKIKPKKWTKEEIDARYEKIKASIIKKYGVHSTLLLPEVKEKQYQTRVKKGLITARENRAPRQLYYDAVVKLTKNSWITYFDKINPERLNRSEWDLDHIFSIQEGFRQSIPPYIIAHWTNLRMLKPQENYSKGKRCDKTQDQLFEDFFKNLE